MRRPENDDEPIPAGPPPAEPDEHPPEPPRSHYPRLVGRDGKLYLSCAEVISFLYEYLADDLDLARRLDFESHLARCASCRDYLASYRETILLSRGAYADDRADADDPALAELPAELFEAILAARG